jgi:hypothetical protein
MIAKERYDLAKMLADIDDDIHEQAKDLSQFKDIPQDVITNLMLENLKKKKKTTQSGAAD